MNRIVRTAAVLIIYCFWFLGYSQTAEVKGIVLDENKFPLPNANIKQGKSGTQTNASGVYQLDIPSNQDIKIEISHVGFESLFFTINLEPGQSYELNPILKTDIEQISTVVISGSDNKKAEGITTLDPETIRITPSANAGVEALLKTLPGVSNNNELSTQYSVRGGNFDENLVYVNDIEVYRPFLIRSGQQEGLSFVNTDLTGNVDFSAGGFQAKYGDRLSSVLDITYRRPTSTFGSFNASLLGGSVAAGGVSKSKRFTAIGGVRYRDNRLLVNSREIEADIQPLFVDAQTYFTYALSDKFELGFLGNVSINQYNFRPISRQTNFGTFRNAMALRVVYDGQEQDQYETYFGALKATYEVNNDLSLKFIASGYWTQEQEHFDIIANYALGAVNSNIGDDRLGDIEFAEGVGSQHTHARNDLDALIFNAQHKGKYIFGGKQQLEWGFKYTVEDFRDRLQEFEILIDKGFSSRPPGEEFVNDQPYTPFEAPLVPFTNVRAINSIRIDRISSYLQYSNRDTWGNHEVWYNAGIRSQNWTVSGKGITNNTQVVFSPRAQFAIKPDWKRKILFRASGGLYHQPPFYRELRDSLGIVRPEVKAQQSIHAVVGAEYSFSMWDRPFKLVTEAYYKYLTDVNPYTIENVRIRYRARNNARAFAQGFDLRLNGEFVPGTESWFSFGYLKTEENIDDRGFIARPTDQRLKFGVLYQDYVPKLPNLKLYINLVYNTGLPGGSPSFADPYIFQSRLPDYRRADVGFSYLIVDSKKENTKNGLFGRFKELGIGFEIYNLFDAQNSITNTFVRNVADNAQFAIPNFLTPRVFNLRLNARF